MADVDVERIRRFVAKDHGLVSVATTRQDGSVQASVVNAGVLDHPVTGAPVVGLVAQGGSAKLAHLRARPQVAVTFRGGWEWLTVEGTAELAGPDDPLAGVGRVSRRAANCPPVFSNRNRIPESPYSGRGARTPPTTCTADPAFADRDCGCRSRACGCRA